MENKISEILNSMVKIMRDFAKNISKDSYHMKKIINTRIRVSLNATDEYKRKLG